MPKKILIIRFSSIGDIVLTTPVIRTVNKQTNAEIHFLTKASFYSVLEGNPYISRIYTIKKSISEVINELRHEQYDFIIDLHKNLRSLQVKSLLLKKSVTFSKLNFKKWLAVNTKINRLPEIHLADRYFKAIKKLNVENDGEGLDYFIPEKDLLFEEDLPDFLTHGFIAIVVGGKHATKIFPEQKTVELIKKISTPVILLGGPEDHDRAEFIRRQIPDIVFNGCGEFNINQSASIINKADLVITNDTGLMHIAAALRKKIVVLWGNTIPHFGMYPYLPVSIHNRYRNIQINDLSCRPCSKIGYERCPKGHFNCMMQIEEDEIIRAIKSLQKDYS